MKTLLTTLLIGMCHFGMAQCGYSKITIEGPVRTYQPQKSISINDSRHWTYEENLTSGVFFLTLTGMAIYGETTTDGPFGELAIIYSAAAAFRLYRAYKIKKRTKHPYKYVAECL